MKQTIELKNLGLRDLSLEEVNETQGGNPIAIGMGIWIGANTLAYSIGYGAHALYDALTD
jgi:pectate lyase